MIHGKAAESAPRYRACMASHINRVLWVFAATFWMGSGCADCETISDCEDACDEAFPMDDVRRDGCYVDCANRDYECSPHTPVEEAS